MLCDYLSNNERIKSRVTPTWIVGQTSSDYSKTIVEQEQALINFRDDQYNVLVATDIVQEGLDVAECSYVIRYEFVSDEIGTVQSRGRARAENSSYYLITSTDSVNHKREEANRKREIEMDDAIKIWEKTDHDEFKRQVENKTNELIHIWENEILAEHTLLSAQRENENVKGIICCKKCNYELGEIAWLKRRNTAYFITNENFFKKTIVSATPYTRVQEILFK
ncbi:unnamed protein product, partial [Didymodactylos carnosus]